MFSFMASQAIALSQAKQESRAPRTRDVALDPAPRTDKKRLLSRVLDALVEARMRRAEIEIEHHRRFYEGHAK